MKISELNTDQTLDVVCEITPYVGNILEDEELTAELKRKLRLGDDVSKAEVYAAGIKKLTKLVPIVLKKHRADVYGIVAAVNGKTPEQIAEQNGLLTAKEIKDIVTDKAFQDFFA